MKKKIKILSVILISLLLLSSCNTHGGIIFDDDEKRADIRTEQIISALKDKDKKTLKSLFSKKALDETADFENDLNYLFEFIQGNVTTGERVSLASDEDIEYGKRSKMIRYGILISTDIDDYNIFVIDYNIDTIDTDNQGVYMLEISKQSYDGEWGGWQERMTPGISFIE